MLTLRIPKAQVLIWNLNYLKEAKKDPANLDHSFMLSKIIDYSQNFIHQDLHIAHEIDLKRYFELLYIARIWGTPAERKAAVEEIRLLISTIKKGDTRKFVETLCGLDRNSNLASLLKLKSSAKIVIVKKLRHRLDYVLKPLAIFSAILTIVSAIVKIILG
jgi:hypothetical protein